MTRISNESSPILDGDAGYVLVIKVRKTGLVYGVLLSAVQ